jgi:Fe-S oxidoreductase
MIDYIRSGRIRLDRSRYAGLTVTYHDPCNYARKSERLFGHGFYEEPRWIMDQCLESWVEMEPGRVHGVCCGGGGGTLTNSYNAERLFYGRRKMDQIRATGAQMVVTPCHGCHGQLSSLKEAGGMPDLKVTYLWELVADCLVVG